MFVSVMGDGSTISRAVVLGVRRDGVTDAALKLQKAGPIKYSRGRVKVLDRSGQSR